jgi:hypothetical protein
MEKNERYEKLVVTAKANDIDREARRITAWNNLKHFEKPDDVPKIPQCPKDEYDAFYIPRLIGAGAIPKKDLIDQQVYIGNHRRCTVAKWDNATNKFMYWRNKFGCVFLETCNHFEDDDGYALFVPIKLGIPKDFEKPAGCFNKK